MKFVKTIIKEMKNGNFSFAILIGTIIQIIATIIGTIVRWKCG